MQALADSANGNAFASLAVLHPIIQASRMDATIDILLKRPLELQPSSLPTTPTTLSLRLSSLLVRPTTPLL
jgi:hypothetical protein